jgi:hypothetical protein
LDCFVPNCNAQALPGDSVCAHHAESERGACTYHAHVRGQETLAELYPGRYERAREDRTPGVHRGKRYDVVQRGHRYNHLAGVDMARARTPDGRVARLDEHAPVAPSYPHVSDIRGSHMEDDIKTDDTATRLDADAVPPPAPAAPAAAAKPVEDSSHMTLSDDDMALVKQMSPEGQAMIMGLMSGEAAEAEAMKVAAMAAGAAAEGDDDDDDEVPPTDDAAPPMAGAVLDAAAVQKMIADAIAAAMAPKPDGYGAPAAEVADKKDRAATDERLIADAAASATRAYNDAAALTEGVRKDGHDGIVGAESATARALAIIDEHLPTLRTDADAALKAGNVASFLRFYDAAEGKRRERLLDAQGAAIVGAFRADDVGLTSAPAPFILPAAHVR